MIFDMPHRRVSGLDGLGVAVLFVLAPHSGWVWAQRGWLGVDIFFVLPYPVAR
jgi:peptidoglycan/LPS O-acetylase OafA/YrhL